jgi:hypothetical protein
MNSARKKISGDRCWSFPVAVADIPEIGRQFDLVADEQVRDALARALDLRALPRLDAHFTVNRRGPGGLHVSGEVSATIGQTCVVSLEPIESEVVEPVDLVFQPPQAVADAGKASEAVEIETGEGPEIMQSGVVDLGMVATEFLILGIDPYPRKAGAVFAAPSASVREPAVHPCAALAALKSRPGGKRA